MVERGWVLYTKEERAKTELLLINQTYSAVRSGWLTPSSLLDEGTWAPVLHGPCVLPLSSISTGIIPCLLFSPPTLIISPGSSQGLFVLLSCWGLSDSRGRHERGMTLRNIRSTRWSPIRRCSWERTGNGVQFQLWKPHFFQDLGRWKQCIWGSLIRPRMF